MGTKSQIAVAAACVAVAASAAVRDRLRPVVLTHGDMRGGVIDERIMSLAARHYMALDVDSRWLDKFRNRSEAPQYGGGPWRYEGLGKLIDAGALLSEYTGDAAVAGRTRHLLEGLRATRDADGYLGFWKPAPDGRQNYVNWTLHEQEYILLGQVRYYLCTGDRKALEDARTMADYILRTFPTRENGIDAKYPADAICTAGLPEAFLALYGVTKDSRYLDFAANVRHGNSRHEIQCASLRTWRQGFAERPCHVYVMTARCYAQTELYRVLGDDSLLEMSRRMRHELFARGRGGMLVTGSCSEKEHFTYDQNGAGRIGESCVTAYMMRWAESMMRLDGDFAWGDVLERSMYNALFAALSPDGRRIRYYTPFSGERRYDDHDDGYCCCGNFRRAMAELPRKVCYVTSDGAVAINMYTPFARAIDVGAAKIRLSCRTDYPNSGDVVVEIGADSSVPVAFRVPRWCDGMTASVNDAEPISVGRPAGGLFVLCRRWMVGDSVRLSMPMPWRLVRGRETQAGRVALMRGPMVFCMGKDQNAELFKTFPSFRDLVVDPASIGEPVADDSIRKGGLKVSALAWTAPDCGGEKVSVVFTEFADPSGMEVYFRVPDMANAAPLPLVDDELINE